MGTILDHCYEEDDERLKKALIEKERLKRIANAKKHAVLKYTPKKYRNR